MDNGTMLDRGVAAAQTAFRNATSRIRRPQPVQGRSGRLLATHRGRWRWKWSREECAPCGSGGRRGDDGKDSHGAIGRADVAGSVADVARFRRDARQRR